MSLSHLVRYALSLPPHVAAAKCASYVGRIVGTQFRQIAVAGQCSFRPHPTGEARGGFGLFSDGPDIFINTKDILTHRFDLLGSGPVVVAAQEPPILSPGNRSRAAHIRGLIDDGYIAIDWHVDFKSGHRWRADRLSGALRYGHEPGVDVKVPWELARLQHLGVLALAGERTEFRNQVLDFTAANPPGYGVNWMCTMDVAIRAANLVLAMDILEGQGEDFDDDFRAEFYALIDAHARHIIANLEDGPIRANHYLADIAGLLFAAAWLPRDSQTEKWVAFAVRELVNETGRQFTNDGANFEASTSYHRLSAEMVAWGTALIIGMEFATLPDWHLERVAKMAEFSRHVTKPNGLVAQIGDNDSGRFFKFGGEACLDHSGVIGAIGGLFDDTDFTVTADTKIVRALVGGGQVSGYGGNGAENRFIEPSGEVEEDWWEIAETIIEPPDASVLDNLTAVSYPDFGLYIWRSDRFFLSMRCGPVGQNGNGGHAHNDQLAMELHMDGEDWLADPGSYLYTPSPKKRGAYRSVHAHAAPRLGSGEPSRLDLGLFRLEDNAKARCLSFTENAFEGVHEGYGEPLYRRVLIEDGRIRVIDGVAKAQSPHQPVTVRDAAALKSLWALDLPFSPAYGKLED